MGGILAGLGSNVKLVIRYDNVLRGFDEVIGKGAIREMEREGVQFVKNARPKAVELNKKYL